MILLKSYIIGLRMIASYRKMHQPFLVITYLEADFTATPQIALYNMRNDFFDNGF